MAEFEIQTLKKKMLRKYPSFGGIINNINYHICDNSNNTVHGHKISRAATDGKTIYVNKDYMSTISESEQIFVLAHEVGHIGLNHIKRIKGRDVEIWNQATDAVINANLLNDKLVMPANCVKIIDALEYNAEHLYAKLLKEKEQQEEKKSQAKNSQNKQQAQSEGQQDGENFDLPHKGESERGNGESERGDGKSERGNDESEIGNGESERGNGESEIGNGESDGQKDESEQNDEGGGQGQEEENNQPWQDEHAFWEEAANEAEAEDEESEEVDEKEIFKQNADERVKRAEEVMKKLGSQRRGMGGEATLVGFSDIGGPGKPVVNWKKMLLKTLEVEDETWGHKFSYKSNGYRARIEDVEYDEMAETEIILDVSGSISLNLLKSFLRQVKTILKESKIKVGTFSNDFHNWIEIKNYSDIDNLKIHVGGGTNFDAASRAFTKRKDVNKICFTDGEDGGNAGIKEKRKDIVWISFENPNFKPDLGKVLYVPPELINLKMKEDYEKE